MAAKHKKTHRKARLLVSERALRQHFSAFNKGFFDGKIHPKTVVKYENLAKHHCTGIWRPLDQELAIDYRVAQLSEHYLLSTLLHEMAHAYLDAQG